MHPLIQVRNGFDELVSIPLTTFTHFVAVSKYVVGYMRDGDSYIFNRQSLARLESTYPGWFVRTHRAAILLRSISADMTLDQSSLMIPLDNGRTAEVPISDRQRAAVLRWLHDGHKISLSAKSEESRAEAI